MPRLFKYFRRITHYGCYRENEEMNFVDDAQAKQENEAISTIASRYSQHNSSTTMTLIWIDPLKD